MRLLHTSDWHLGRHTYNVARRPDHEAVVAEIVALAGEHRPDVIVHTGDLFDTGRPAVTDMTFAIETLRELAGIAPTVVLAGNHDSPALFELFDSMLGGPGSRLRFIARPARPADGGILDFPVGDDQRLRLAPVPFVHANRMIDALEDPATWLGSYQDRIHVIEEMLGAGLAAGYRHGRDVLVFAAHLHVGGVSVSNSERAAFVKAAYETQVNHLPQVSYAAFGHIHRPQALPSGANVRGRYAGSPIQLDFGEVGEEKSIVVVDAGPARPAAINTVPLTGGRPLRRFEGTLAQLQELAPSIGAELVLATIDTTTPAVGLVEAVRDLLPSCEILEVTERCAARASTALSGSDLPSGSEPTFAELFGEYVSESGVGRSSVKAVMDTFATLIDAVDAGEPAAFGAADALVGAGTRAGGPTTTSVSDDLTSAGQAGTEPGEEQACGR